MRQARISFDFIASPIKQGNLSIYSITFQLKSAYQRRKHTEQSHGSVLKSVKLNCMCAESRSWNKFISQCKQRLSLVETRLIQLIARVLKYFARIFFFIFSPKLANKEEEKEKFSSQQCELIEGMNSVKCSNCHWFMQCAKEFIVSGCKTNKWWNISYHRRPCKRIGKEGATNDSDLNSSSQATIYKASCFSRIKNLWERLSRQFWINLIDTFGCGGKRALIRMTLTTTFRRLF